MPHVNNSSRSYVEIRRTIVFERLVQNSLYDSDDDDGNSDICDSFTATHYTKLIQQVLGYMNVMDIIILLTKQLIATNVLIDLYR